MSCVVDTKSYYNNKIYSCSPLVLKARESILEKILLNHSIDCGICDQAGECDLQNYLVINKSTDKRFYSYKRNVPDFFTGEIIATHLTRCIHCTRCVRFCSEVAGLKELGMFNRGVKS